MFNIFGPSRRHRRRKPLKIELLNVRTSRSNHINFNAAKNGQIKPKLRRDFGSKSTRNFTLSQSEANFEATDDLNGANESRGLHLLNNARYFYDDQGDTLLVDADADDDVVESLRGGAPRFADLHELAQRTKNVGDEERKKGRIEEMSLVPAEVLRDEVETKKMTGDDGYLARNVKALAANAVPGLSQKALDAYECLVKGNEINAEDGNVRRVNFAQFLMDEQGLELFEQFLDDEGLKVEKSRLYFCGHVDLFKLQAENVNDMGFVSSSRFAGKVRDLALHLWFLYFYEKSSKFIDLKTVGVGNEGLDKQRSENECDALLKDILDEDLGIAEVIEVFDSIQEEVTNHLEINVFPQFLTFFKQRMDELIASYEKNIESKSLLTAKVLRPVEILASKSNSHKNVDVISEKLENLRLRKNASSRSNKSDADKDNEFYFIDEFIGFFCGDNGSNLKPEGIFRVNGVAEKADKLAELFRRKPWAFGHVKGSEVLRQLVHVKMMSLNDVCSAFKQLLTKTNSPLVPDQMNDDLCRIYSAYGDNNPELKEAFEKVLTKYVVQEGSGKKFEYLVKVVLLLKEIEKNKDCNKMSAANLGTCFMNVLLSKRNEPKKDMLAAMKDIKEKSGVIKALIELDIQLPTQLMKNSTSNEAVVDDNVNRLLQGCEEDNAYAKLPVDKSLEHSNRLSRRLVTSM